jgi:hypothetical protein
MTLNHTYLGNGRTSGAYVSDHASLLMGPGNAIFSMGLAALEITNFGQVLCESENAASEFAERDIDIPRQTDAESSISDTIVDGCTVRLLVSGFSSFGSLSIPPRL